jgi:hypothetical protein
MTDDSPRWVEEGWKVFMAEVLAKNWPDVEEIRVLCEACFYGGANWVRAILGEEGFTREVYDKLSAELTGHADRMRERVRSLSK